MLDKKRKAAPRPPEAPRDPHHNIYQSLTIANDIASLTIANDIVDLAVSPYACQEARLTLASKWTVNELESILLYLQTLRGLRDAH